MAKMKFKWSSRNYRSQHSQLGNLLRSLEYDFQLRNLIMAQALQRSFVRLGQDPKVAISSMVNDDQVRALPMVPFPSYSYGGSTTIGSSNSSTLLVDHWLLFLIILLPLQWSARGDGISDLKKLADGLPGRFLQVIQEKFVSELRALPGDLNRIHTPWIKNVVRQSGTNESHVFMFRW